MQIGDQSHSYPRWGEYGGSLHYLASCLTTPQSPQESNFYIDMLGASFRTFAAGQGLTNNRALFVISHGKAINTDFGVAYALYPSDSMIRPPCYSVRDLARILGPRTREIHNLVLAGCNLENMFDAREFKQYFVNATNIIHALPGTDATIGNFQDLLTFSAPELGARSFTPASRSSIFGGQNPFRAGRYVADLYRPGERKPYRQVIAGRELLAGTPLPSIASHATNSFRNPFSPVAINQ